MPPTKRPTKRAKGASTTAKPRKTAAPKPVKRSAPAPHASSGPKSTRAPAAHRQEITVPRDAIAFAASRVRDVPDFPKPGVTFKDITPLLANPRAFHIVLDVLAERFIGEHIDAVVGIDARGFIFGGALAARLNASFIPARKPGKLPADVDQVTYKTEYSIDTLEMHKDSIVEESRVIIVDDVLATGGTAKAAAELVRLQGGFVIAHAFVIELTFLGGREKLLPVKVESVIRY